MTLSGYSNPNALDQKLELDQALEMHALLLALLPSQVMLLACLVTKPRHTVGAELKWWQATLGSRTFNV